jgi:biopolymer transport protein ExbD/biopolymer transport protein TolR
MMAGRFQTTETQRKRRDTDEHMDGVDWMDEVNGPPAQATEGGTKGGASAGDTDADGHFLGGGAAVMAFTASSGRTQTSLSDINITPLVDVVLVLLIIFMVTAPVLQSGIEVNVPRTRSVKEITEERLVVSINKQQRVFLGNDAININEIGAKLKQKIRDPQHQSIFIRADEDVPFGAFATVMDAVKGAGITNVSIVTQPLDSNASRR